MIDIRFPSYPQIKDLPAGMTEKERHEFALQLLAEQGYLVGDYLFAAVRSVRTLRGVEARDLMERWAAMSELVQEIYGSPITLSYRACDRIAAEGSAS